MDRVALQTASVLANVADDPSYILGSSFFSPIERAFLLYIYMLLALCHRTILDFVIFLS